MDGFTAVYVCVLCIQFLYDPALLSKCNFSISDSITSELMAHTFTWIITQMHFVSCTLFIYSFYIEHQTFAIPSIRYVAVCPLDVQTWNKREQEFGCQNSTDYHCITTSADLLVELCIGKRSISSKRRKILLSLLS